MFQRIKESEQYLINLGIFYDIAYFRGERIDTTDSVFGTSKRGAKRYKQVELENAKFMAFIIPNPNDYGIAFLAAKIEKLEYLHVHKGDNKWFVFMPFSAAPKEMCWIDTETKKPCTLLSISEYVRWLRDFNNIETNTGTITFNCNNGSLDYWVSGMSKDKSELKYVVLNKKAQDFIPKGNDEYKNPMSCVKTMNRKDLSKELQNN